MALYNLEKMGVEWLSIGILFVFLNVTQFVWRVSVARGAHKWLCWLIASAILAFGAWIAFPIESRFVRAHCRRTIDYAACMKDENQVLPYSQFEPPKD